jgi:hypothetical protein
VNPIHSFDVTHWILYQYKAPYLSARTGQKSGRTADCCPTIDEERRASIYRWGGGPARFIERPKVEHKATDLPAGELPVAKHFLILLLRNPNKMTLQRQNEWRLN